MGRPVRWWSSSGAASSPARRARWSPGTVVVVDGTVSDVNDVPSTSATASFAWASGTSLASVKYGSSALASSAWPYP